MPFKTNNQHQYSNCKAAHTLCNNPLVFWFFKDHKNVIFLNLAWRQSHSGRFFILRNVPIFKHLKELQHCRGFGGQF